MRVLRVLRISALSGARLGFVLWSSCVCVGALACSGGADAPLTAAAPPRESVQETPSACVRTEACGGDPVGPWRIVSMCTRAPEIMFDAYTSLPGTKCKGQVRAAELNAEGSLSVSTSLVLDTDYQLDSRLEVEWSGRCLDAAALSEPDCLKLRETLQTQTGVTVAACSLTDAACACELFVSLHVQAQGLDSAREVFAKDEHCVMGERMSLDDASASLLLERSHSAP
jgi:hypothetical protein